MGSCVLELREKCHNWVSSRGRWGRAEGTARFGRGQRFWTRRTVIFHCEPRIRGRSQVAEAQPRAEHPRRAARSQRARGNGRHGGSLYPTRWRCPYAEGCVRMAPKTVATLMRTRVFTAWWVRWWARSRHAWSPSGSGVSPEHVAPVRPGMPRRCPEPREQPSRAMGVGRGHGLGRIRCCTGASAFADDSEGAARTAFSAATGRAEAHSAAGCIYLAGSSVRVAEVKPVQCWRRRSGVDGQSGWRGLGSGLGLGLGSL